MIRDNKDVFLLHLSDYDFSNEGYRKWERAAPPIFNLFSFKKSFKKKQKYFCFFLINEEHIKILLIYFLFQLNFIDSLRYLTVFFKKKK